jgi:hypothetical protein
VRHIKKEANCVAHHLTKVAINQSLEQVLIIKGPLYLNNITSFSLNQKKKRKKKACNHETRALKKFRPL